MTKAQDKAREKADANRLLARLRCWLIRSRLITNEIEGVGVDLHYGRITLIGAYQVLADLAIDADCLAAGLAEGEEILPDLVQGDVPHQHAECAWENDEGRIQASHGSRIRPPQNEDPPIGGSCLAEAQ
jgi:hypothetical protein